MTPPFWKRNKKTSETPRDIETSRASRGTATSNASRHTPIELAVEANNAFALALHHQLSDTNADQNLFWSPFSMSNALTMTAAGARYETAEEMGRALAFPDTLHRGDASDALPWDLAPLHPGFATMAERLQPLETAATAEIRARIDSLRDELATIEQRVSQLLGTETFEEISELFSPQERLTVELNDLLTQVGRYEIRVANALWGERTYPFRQDFIDTLERHYGNGVAVPVDFVGNHEAERRRINAWAEEQTHGRIRDLLPAGSVDELARLVLANAIYFKGDWAEPFEELETEPRDFALASGDHVETPMMHQHGLESARYGAFRADGSFFDTPHHLDWRGRSPTPGENGWTALELRYTGGEVSMVLFAPERADGLSTIEKQLTPRTLNRWIDCLERRTVHVFLPKFKLETDYRMREPLQRLGMVRAFQDPSLPGGAQLDGMTESSDPMEQLQISEVFHKAFVEVNEQGTEAAAATGMLMSLGASMQMQRPYTPTFKADRPFLFLIRHAPTGAILFAGRMMQPS